MRFTASFNEKLLLSNGLCVSPLSGQNTTGQSQSLRDVVHSIDNSRDLHNYLASHISKVGPKLQEIRYQPHPVCSPKSEDGSDKCVDEDFRPSLHHSKLLRP